MQGRKFAGPLAGASLSQPYLIFQSCLVIERPERVLEKQSLQTPANGE